MAPTHYLTDVDPIAITICKKGANRQRIFLKKEADGGPLITLPAQHRLFKSGDDWHVFYCVVAEPGAEEECGQGDDAGTGIVDVWKSDEDIATAAHRFLKNKAYVNLMHDAMAEEGCTVVENAVALNDIQIGPDTIKKGSWYVAIEPSPEVRQQIDAGEFTGVSIEGSGFREAIAKASFAGADKCSGCGGKVAKDAAKCPNCGAKSSVKKADKSPDAKIPNKPGKTNWLERRGGFPPYMRRVIEDILGGNPAYLATSAGVSKAISIGVGIVKNWKDGHDGKGNKVSAATQAKAAKAWDSWEKKKAGGGAVKKMADELPPVTDEELAAASGSVLVRMEREDNEAVGLFKKLGGMLGLSDDEVELRKSDTFASAMAARELDDELPQAFDVLRSVVWRAFSPYNENPPADPAAVVGQSLDEFKAWALELLGRVSGGGDGAKIAKALGINPDALPDEGATLESEMDQATADKLLKSSEDTASALDKLVTMIGEGKLVTPAAKDDGDENEPKGKKVKKSDEDEPTAADLKKSLDKMTEGLAAVADRLDDFEADIERLADSGSEQRDGDERKVAKSSDPLAGLLGA